LREAFLEMLEDFCRRDVYDEDPPATAAFAFRGELREISIERACGIFWNCMDILPGDAFLMVQSIAEHHRLPLGMRTYAAAARLLRATLPAARAA
jgi:hypothetical protein